MPKGQSPSLATVVASLQKTFGPRSVIQAKGENDPRRVPIGVFHLDRILGGGLPINRPIHIGGHKAAYKTTMALKAFVNYQMLCGVCFLHDHLCQCKGGPTKKKLVYVDVERALNEEHSVRIGIDPSRLFIAKPDYGEEACEVTESLLEVPEVGGVIFDSLAAIKGKVEVENGYLDSIARGIRAQLISRLMRALITIADDPDNPRLVIIINHLLPQQKGLGDYYPGGETQLYFSSVVLKFWTKNRKRYEISKEGEESEADFGETEGKKVRDIPEAKKQEIGFLIERSKVSRENIAGEFKMFLEEEQGVRFGDADDWNSVFLYGQRQGKVYLNDNSQWQADGMVETFQTQKALMQFWKERPEVFAAFKLTLK